MVSFSNANNLSRHLFSLGLLILVSACGGGGGSTPAVTPPPPTVQNNDLNVTLDGAGSGQVTSTPAGISCGNDCSQSFSGSTNVTLQETAQAGSSFNGWSGDCSGMGACSFDMSVGRNVTAQFIVDTTPTENDLTVTVIGQGSVTSSPVGIDCETDCSETYDSSEQISLAVVSDPGFTFDGWSGACTGTGACDFDMSIDRLVTATFIADSGSIQNTLSVTVVGSGSVTSDPVGVDCESDCSEDYDDDTVVTLTAIPDTGFMLNNWSGDCSSNTSCVVTISEARSVTAIFVAINQSSILIENYSPQGDAFQLEEPLTTNASGITWHKELQQYLVVRNGSAIMFRYDENFTYLGNFVRVENLISTDTEGLAYVSNNKVLIVSEDGYASKVEVLESTETVSGISPDSQRYRIMAAAGNNGLEGIAVKIGTQGQLDRVYAVKEGSGGSMRFVHFDMPAPDPLTLLDYQSNLTVTEPWDANQIFAGQATDLAGIVYDERTGHVIIVSHESSRALQVDPDTGSIISTLELSGANQFEGVTIGPNGELVFVSEPNSIRIYELN
ncbi:MAG: hypothetical protein ACJAS9_001595 [Polaribacter sp.]|jgi:uncharacterized protein YjiK